MNGFGIAGLAIMFPLMALGLILIFVLALVLIFRGGSKRREDPEMRAEVDDLWELANRIEKRMENLETILTDRTHPGREAE